MHSWGLVQDKCELLGCHCGCPRVSSDDRYIFQSQGAFSSLLHSLQHSKVLASAQLPSCLLQQQALTFLLCPTQSMCLQSCRGWGAVPAVEWGSDEPDGAAGGHQPELFFSG